MGAEIVLNKQLFQYIVLSSLSYVVLDADAIFITCFNATDDEESDTLSNETPPILGAVPLQNKRVKPYVE
jgi:hypothetical protein